MNLDVNEIFYSLQGEGGRQGEASIFIRLSHCNLKCDFCDTGFSSGQTMNIQQILSVIHSLPCRWIIWTGGEPTLQLTNEIIAFFKSKGYLQAIESNGTRILPDGLDYTVVSPKGNPDYAKKINPVVDEIRLPVQSGDVIPGIERLPAAKFYFISPVFNINKEETQANIRFCVEYIKQRPQWRLSLQIHKLIGIE
ncbi:MAG: 7-carboxy-7-deazaguanine synthase QueE [Dysgonamonadaceae bacterium]|jgi:organic radical activating enzyme|nr:7-carboxy-7-deazaguanine synthase QueE [Dysgonamonadaceae bacterium]